jgi:uncharacterized protein YigE (DUF2233 family)
METVMKYIYSILLVVSIVVAVIWYSLFGAVRSLKDLKNVSIGIENNVSPTPMNIGISLRYDNQDYTVVIYTVHPSEHVYLLPNFSEKKSSSIVAGEHLCSMLSNGGFYTPDSKPLGFFALGDEVLTQKITSATFNGFFWKDAQAFHIHFNDPDQTPDWIIQSGPLIIIEGNPTKLHITNDETKRRMIVALNSSGIPIFLSVFTKDQANSGPLLSDLPQIIDRINSQENLYLMWALNLDGGSASAFISPEISLSELKPVGSFFCVK